MYLCTWLTAVLPRPALSVRPCVRAPRGSAGAGWSAGRCPVAEDMKGGGGRCLRRIYTGPLRPP